MISSTGGAARREGGVLGQFEYHEDKGYYMQTSTEQKNEWYRAVYLYRMDADGWYVGDTHDIWLVNGAWLYNPSTSKTPPTSGWQYANGDTFASWSDDPTLTVTPGPLSPLPKQFRVTASGAQAEEWAPSLGVFNRTERWWWGRPVYINAEGLLLHHGSRDLGWMIGQSINDYFLRGSRSHHSPASEDTWTYWAGSELKPASVTVTAMEN